MHISPQFTKQLDNTRFILKSNWPVLTDYSGTLSAARRLPLKTVFTFIGVAHSVILTKKEIKQQKQNQSWAKS